MPTNTRDRGFCNICGAKTEGSESKIKLWIKLHFKQNHPKDDTTTIGIQELHFDKTSRRNRNKYDFAKYREEKDNPHVLKFE